MATDAPTSAAPPTLAERLASLRDRLTALTARGEEAGKAARALTERAKGLMEVRGVFQKIADLRAPAIQAMAKRAFDAAVAADQEIARLTDDVQYEVQLRREFGDAWARAWADCETTTARPAEGWYAAMAGDRGQTRAWLDQARERLTAAERRWLPAPKGTVPPGTT